MSLFAREELDSFRADWTNQGYLVVKRLVSDDVVDGINTEFDRCIGPDRKTVRSGVTTDILHGPLAGKLMRAQDAPDEAFQGPFKVNNLFVESEATRRGTFHPHVLELLGELLGSPPLAINSLNFYYGSQQPAHIDSWYMPPPDDSKLAVASIFLEDVTEDNGPLFYYPGSHKIPPHRFSHGGLAAVASEMDACNAYIQNEIEARGLRKETLMAKKGDLLLWHCQLLHGGCPINRFDQTRRSLVTHYWGSSIVSADRVASFGDGELYLERDYKHVDDEPSNGESSDETPARRTSFLKRLFGR